MKRRRFTAAAVFDRYGARTTKEQELALRDVAQDHFLMSAHRQGIFASENGIRFMGGTSLRKHRFGHESRISHDIDINVASQAVKSDVVRRLDKLKGGPFRFRVVDGKPMQIRVASRMMEEPTFIKLDISTDDREEPLPRFTPPVIKPMLSMPAADLYGWQPESVGIPTMTVEENIAEKLCRHHYKPVARDTFDLAQLSEILIAKAPLIAKLAARSMWKRTRGGLLTQNPVHGLLTISTAYKQLSPKALQAMMDRDDRETHTVDFIPGVDDDELLDRFGAWYRKVNRSLEPFHEAILADERLIALSFWPQRRMRCDVPPPTAGLTPDDFETMLSDVEEEIAASLRMGYFTDIPEGYPPRITLKPIFAEQRNTAAAQAAGHFCGARTVTTPDPCRRRVSRPGGRCFDHR